MAAITFEGYFGNSPAWTDLGANTVVFCGSLTDLTASILVNAYQDGTHVGNGDPGTDQCGTTHMNNVKYISAASGTMSLNGAANVLLNDTNLSTTGCTLRLHFNNGSAVAVAAAKFYCFDGSVTTNPAVGVDVYAFERGISGTTWTHINDESAGIGGNNAGERLDLANSTGTSQNHYWYLAISAAPESSGDKASFDFGMTLTYS